MTTNTTRRRSRERAYFTIDLRQLRLARGSKRRPLPSTSTNPSHSCSIKRKRGGMPTAASSTTLKTSTSRMLLLPLRLETPIVVKSATTIYWLRHGLGLTDTEAGKILKLRPAAVEDIETASRAFPDDLRHKRWATYVEWASRAVRRQER